jgi:endonuclease/exonuclease/phosphatase (EEP) superfamily protein YafD
VVVVPLLAVALARVVAWDARSTLVGLNALTPFLYLPAWPVAVGAGLGRRWPLLAAALVVVVAHLAFVAPELAAREALPAAAASAPTMRLYDANVLVGNQDAAGYAAEMARARPDVVVLQEATPAFVAALDATGVLAELPNRITVPRTDPSAALVASRWALTDQEVVSIRGRPVLVTATIDYPDHSVRLLAFHAVAPVGGGRQEWIDDLARLGRAVGVGVGPVLVSGDFNATWGHRAFRRLLDAGLVDAVAARGRPYQMTWPRDRRFVPPLTRIDHVLTRGPLAVTSIRTGDGRGSDHRPLVADVALL